MFQFMIHLTPGMCLPRMCSLRTQKPSAHGMMACQCSICGSLRCALWPWDIRTHAMVAGRGAQLLAVSS